MAGGHYGRATGKEAFSLITNPLSTNHPLPEPRSLRFEQTGREPRLSNAGHQIKVSIRDSGYETSIAYSSVIAREMLSVIGLIKKSSTDRPPFTIKTSAGIPGSRTMPGLPRSASGSISARTKNTGWL